MMNNFKNSININTPFVISIYDSITMPIITDLSRQSILLGNKTIDISDYTDRRWIDNTKHFENSYYIKNNVI